MGSKKDESKPVIDQELLNSIMNGDSKLSGIPSKSFKEEAGKQTIPKKQEVKMPVPEENKDVQNDGVKTSDEQGETGEPVNPGEVQDEALPAKPRTGSRQRKASFEEYRKQFLETPRIDDRKTVFISGTLRDKLDEVARKLGDRKMSVSGFIENLIRHHLDVYEEDLNAWKKL